MRVALNRLEIALAALAFVFGLLVAFTTLGRGIWLDEFWTLYSTEQPDPAAFATIMSREVHPALHYGLVYVAQTLGVTDVSALRALNLIGIPFVLWAGWLALRHQALSARQACVLAALYASSAMFLDSFAELRAYFLLLSASVAMTLIWRILMRKLERSEPWSFALLAAWFIALCAFVNLHYFATLLGAVLTLSLIAFGRMRAIPLAVVSLLAAAPAALLAFAQMQNSDPGMIGWIATGRIDAIFLMLDSIWQAAGFNVVALGCAALTLLLVLEQRATAKDARDELALIVVLGLYFMLLTLINAARPVVIDRYLIAAGGVTIVAVSLLAGSAQAPRWGVAAICVFALAVQARALYSRTYDKPGWTGTASAVAALVEACPATRVFMYPSADTPDVETLVAVRRYGQTYYARQFGFNAEEAQPGDTIAPGADCPNVIWLEHFVPESASAESELARLRLSTDGHVELTPIGRGALILVRR